MTTEDRPGYVDGLPTRTIAKGKAGSFHHITDTSCVKHNTDCCQCGATKAEWHLSPVVGDRWFCRACAGPFLISLILGGIDVHE